MNEAFQPPMGPGFGGGPGGPGGPGGATAGRPASDNPFSLDPLVGLNDASKPLRSRLLAVSSLKKRYLEHVKTIAEKSLDWQTLGPVVSQYEKLIKQDIAADTRKLTSFVAFEKALREDGKDEDRRHPSLATFARMRRSYLLEYPEIKALSENK